MTRNAPTYIALSLAIGGCVPAMTTYYEPSAASGVTMNAQCGAIAPGSTIRFAVNLVDIRVTGSEHALEVAFRIPKGSTLKLTSPDVIVSFGEQSKKYSLVNLGYYDRDRKVAVMVPITETLIGANDKYTFGIEEPRIYGASLEWPKTEDERYVAQLPAFSIDGQSTTLPPITFERKKALGIYSVNC